MDEFLTATRLNELLCKKEAEEKKKNIVLWALAIIGAVVAVAGIVYAVYRYLTPEYLDDLEEELEDEFEDDFFDEDDEEV